MAYSASSRISSRTPGSAVTNFHLTYGYGWLRDIVPCRELVSPGEEDHLSLLTSAWVLSWFPALVLTGVVLLLLRRRNEIQSYRKTQQERLDARERGSDRARLQHPSIDLTQCIGCGLCVDACPEDGVLALMYGQAVVVHGGRCVGHGRCAEACPAGAIAITLGDLSDRRDLPALREDLEAVGVPGLYLAGEITGFALVRTAVTHGVLVAESAARRRQASSATAGRSENKSVHELLIIGAGPAGIACALRAKELGLEALILNQEEHVGGTVASYPRRKMVMTQPVDLPLHGRLPRMSYQREELIELWEGLSQKHQLAIDSGVHVSGFQAGADGIFRVDTNHGVYEAKNLCLAIGRRGTPRKLDIPGESLPKVCYSLLDAESYQGRRILVVGGGDSAIEAAVGLSKQPGNTVTLSYRKHAFFRLKAKNEYAIRAAIEKKELECLYESAPTEILPDAVKIRAGQNGHARDFTIENDDVFVFAGGVPPFALLEQGGISFDPKDRPDPVQTAEESRGLLNALAFVLFFAVAMLAWTQLFGSYYQLPVSLRVVSPHHMFLRPGGPFGLGFGLFACVLFVFNLAYLVRRSLKWGQRIPGTLQKWLASHVFTGLFALLCVLVHSGFVFKDTAGGHALIALLVVVLAGCVGRYLYAFVPRAANGAEAGLDDLRAQLATLSSEWDKYGRQFGHDALKEIDALASSGRWSGNLFARIYMMITGQLRMRAFVRRLREKALRANLSAEDIQQFEGLVRGTYKLTLQTIHYEELRSVLSLWRYYHRWLALLMIILAAIHIYTAVSFADLQIWGGWAGVP